MYSPGTFGHGGALDQKRGQTQESQPHQQIKLPAYLEVHPALRELYRFKTISRVAYGFRNFEDYRIRVKVLCS